MVTPFKTLNTALRVVVRRELAVCWSLPPTAAAIDAVTPDTLLGARCDNSILPRPPFRLGVPRRLVVAKLKGFGTVRVLRVRVVLPSPDAPLFGSGGDDEEEEVVAVVPCRSSCELVPVYLELPPRRLADAARRRDDSKRES